MITIDPEFQMLLPPLTADEYRQLEENILRDGVIRDPLVVWPQEDGTDILIDGHNRWSIARKHQQLFVNYKQMHFADREEAKLWILRNQLGRRNVPDYVRTALALKLKPVIAKKAKERQRGGQGGVLLSQKSDEANGISTKKEIAKIAGVSHDTVYKVEVIEKEADEHTKQLLRAGEKSINQAYNEIKAREIKRMPTAQEYQDAAQKRHDAVKDAKTLTIGDIQQDKRDRKLLEDAAFSKLTRASEAVSRLYVQANNGELNADILPPSSKDKIVVAIEIMIGTLEQIRAMIEGK